VAKHLGTDHHELRVDPNISNLLPELARVFDEPFGDSSAVPMYLLARETRNHVTVALSGDGGDELFAGYERYRAMRLAASFDRLPAPLRAAVANRLWQRLPTPGRQKSMLRRLQRLNAALTAPSARRYAEIIAIFNEAQRAELYSEVFLRELPNHDPVDFVSSVLSRASKRDVGTAASLADLVTYLPGDLCHKVDMCAMAHGLECRQPMLDHRLVELAVAMPISLKLRYGRGKRILKRAFGHLLPPEVFCRRKMGFGVPLDHWFRNGLKILARDTLLSTNGFSRRYFRAHAIEQLLNEHTVGRFDHSARLWSLLMLELWQRQWLT
jgi:asparagine synthase (glutamine-hydrolysing)